MAEEVKEEIVKKKNMLDVIMEWSLARKLSLVAVALVSVAVFSVIIMQSQVADYSLLFANLPNRDASSVVEWLKDRKILIALKMAGGIS